MSTEQIRILLEKDECLNNELRVLYGKLLHSKKQIESITLILSLRSWFGADHLNMILSFLEVCSSMEKSPQIFVELFEKKLWDIFVKKRGITSNTNAKKIIINKLVYFNWIGFLKILKQINISFFPPLSSINNKIKLSSYDYNPSHFLTKMMPIQLIVQSEKEQFLLKSRISNLNSIVMNHLRAQINFEKIKVVNQQLVFELVKNIFQHSCSHGHARSSNNSGLICAQISKHSVFRWNRNLQELIFTILERDKPYTEDGLKWLSITINDFGHGLDKVVKKELMNRLSENKKLKYGRLLVTENFLMDPANLIEIAISTDFTSKKIGNYSIQPPLKGFGLLFLLKFIGSTFGRMRIRSGKVIYDISTTPELYVQLSLNKDRGIEYFLNKIEPFFSKFFNKKTQYLSGDESVFPGTQITIEVPVIA